MRTKLLLVPVGIVCLMALAGCSGDRRVSVHGKVTLAGKGPLGGGNIQFVSVADPTKVGGGLIKPDGSYMVPDAPVGDCKVVIDNTHLDPNANKGTGLPGGGGPGVGMGGKGMKGMPGAGPPVSGPKAGDKAKMGESPKGADVPAEMSGGKDDLSDRKYAKIEASYTKADSTPLSAKVEKDGQTFDFDVK